MLLLCRMFKKHHSSLLLIVLIAVFFGCKTRVPQTTTTPTPDVVEDSVVVGQDWKEDIRVVLFIKMTEGYQLTDKLKKRIRTTIRNAASPRHVPGKIFEVPDIPYTLNMKKVELAVKKVIQGQEVKNKDSLRNPEVLDYYASLKGLQED